MPWAGVVALCLCLSAARTGWAQAVQFDASRNATLTVDASSAVMEWRAVGDGPSLATVHPGIAAWSLAVATESPQARSVDFAVPGVASPLHASGSAETVAYVFAVVRCQEPSDLATLLDAPSPVRFLPAPWLDDPHRLDTTPLGGSAEYAVNGDDTEVR